MADKNPTADIQVNIDSTLQEQRRFEPPEHFSQRAHIKSLPKGPSNKRDEKGNPLDPQREAMKKLWALLKPVRGDKQDWLQAEAWLDKEKIINRNQEISKLSAEELRIVIEKSEIALNPE